MKIIIDTEKSTLVVEANQETLQFGLYSDIAFKWISDFWLKVGWNQKYPYTFSWLGRPIIQIPEDIVRMQEVIYALKPSVIIETGVAHGGSLMLSAGLCKIIGRGRVIGIDIEIKPHNRQAIENHPLSSFITLIEGSSTSDDVLRETREHITTEDTVMVILDSCHSAEHVIKELNTYAQFVTLGSYIVATDGSMMNLHDVPRADPNWITDNPVTAINEFLASNSDFRLVEPPILFNESTLDFKITHWPQAWLQRIA